MSEQVALPEQQIRPPEIDTKRNSFQCKDVEYFIETAEHLGIKRRVEYDKLMMKWSNGVDYLGAHNATRRMIEHFNKGQYTKLGVELENSLVRTGEAENEEDPILMICCLFMNLKDEDRTQVPTESEQQDKIQGWSEGGVPAFFFQERLTSFIKTYAAKFYDGSKTT